MSAPFDSLETDEPFRNCCACDCLLPDANAYIVNKSFVGHECVFEMAMCIDCRENMNDQLSEESRVAMFDFMHDNADMEKREQELGTNSETDAYIAQCITCGVDASSLKNYSLGAMFSGNELLKGPFPMMMCGNCEEKLGETISDETRDVWDRFIGEHFPGPPSEIKLPTGKPILI